MKGRSTYQRNAYRWLYLLALIFVIVSCNRANNLAPSDIGVAVGVDAITITWQDNSEGETGFAVDRKLASDVDFAELAVVDPNTVMYTDSTVVVGESYVYRVRALGLEGGEASSTETEPVTPAPKTTVTLGILFSSNSTGSGRVSSSPEGLDCTLKEGSVCQAPFPIGSTVTLTAAPEALSSFVGWVEGCEGTSPACQVELTENKTVQVRFVPVQNTLTVQKAGDGAGRITSGTPPDINCGEACVASYEGEIIFRLRAEADVGSSFVGWSENCKLVGKLCEVKIGGGKGATVTATFNKIPPPAINAFAALPTTAVVGSNVVFSWKVMGEGVSSLVLKDDKPATPDITVTGQTSYTLKVQETATYTLVATNAFGGSTTSSSITVRVGTVPVLSALAATTNTDGSFTLSWNATGNKPITYKLIEETTNTEVLPAPKASPYIVKPTAFPATYRLEASNEFGVAIPRAVTIEPPVPAEILSFIPSTDYLIFPGKVTLSWVVQASEPVTLTLTRDDTGEVIGLSELTGVLEVEVVRDTRFTLDVQNPFGSDEEEERVRVRRDK
jgi:Divergent InlB B-repeat domain